MAVNMYYLDWEEEAKDRCAAFTDLRDMIWLIRSLLDRKTVTEIKVTIINDQDTKVFYIEKKTKLKDIIITDNKKGDKYVKESK